MAATDPLEEDDSLAGLELRICAAEQRLVAREQALMQRWERLRGDVGQGVAGPGRLLGGVGGLAGLFGLWRLLFGRRPAAPAGVHGPAQPAHAALLSLIVPVVWPLLPARWRRHVSPALATTLLGVALPLVAKVLKREPPADAPPTAPRVDLERYMGSWYEIARLPTPHEKRCAGQPQADYAPLGDGMLGVRNRCPAADGSESAALGVAQIQPDGGGARLKVCFAPAWLRWLPLVWDDYWILAVDEDGYQWALVGTPDRRRLWLLARLPVLDAARRAALVEQARALGYPVESLIDSGA